MHDDDKKFWQQATQDVIPLKENRTIHPPKQKKSAAPLQKIMTEGHEVTSIIFHDVEREYPEYIFFARPGLQYRLQHQLRQGKIRPQATLDLHGMTVEEARICVTQFLNGARTHHLRTVKIIHGKGESRGAILRNKVYQWLPQHPDILAFCSTINSEGGTGAVYVLLSRKS